MPPKAHPRGRPSDAKSKRAIEAQPCRQKICSPGLVPSPAGRECRMPGARRNRRERADPMQHHQRPPSPGRKRQNAAIGKTVREALNQNRLLFAFQPVVCATSGRIDYFECLLRMREHDNRLVTCGEFIAAIEQVGLIGLIDRYVLGARLPSLPPIPGSNSASTFPGSPPPTGRGCAR